MGMRQNSIGNESQSTAGNGSIDMRFAKTPISELPEHIVTQRLSNFGEKLLRVVTILGKSTGANTQHESEADIFARNIRKYRKVLEAKSKASLPDITESALEAFAELKKKRAREKKRCCALLESVKNTRANEPEKRSEAPKTPSPKKRKMAKAASVSQTVKEKKSPVSKKAPQAKPQKRESDLLQLGFPAPLIRTLVKAGLGTIEQLKHADRSTIHEAISANRAVKEPKMITGYVIETLEKIQ